MQKNRLSQITILRKQCKYVDCLFAPLTVVVILLAVFAIKGVYPFGNNTVSYYDMSGSYIPIYTYFWDVLHGKSGIYLNWYSGLGVSMADVVGIFLFFPTNLFFLFTTRDGIIYSMSFFVMFKMALCAFSMSFYYKKHYEGLTGIFCSGILYAFCGFAIQYYTNIFYFDLVLLFPILVWAFERLILEHKYILFTVLMFFAFFTNVQLVFMVGIYLLFKGYFLLKKVEKDARSKSIALFAASVVTALMMASFVLVPSISQTVQSTRTKENSEFVYKDVMSSVYSKFRVQKHFMMYGSEIAVGLIILILIRGKEILKKYYTNIAMIVLLCIPILHEGINRLWHAGSYKHFPVRFGYMITFECIILVADYCRNEEFTNIKYISKVAKLVGMASIPFSAYVLYDFCKQFTIRGIDDLGVYYSYWIYFWTFAVLYLICFIMESAESRKGSIICLVMIQAVCGCYGFIAPKQAEMGRYRNESVYRSLDLRKKLSHERDFGKRIKTDAGEFESNDAMIYQYPSICAWLYGMPAETETELERNMGYDGRTSYVYDTGGTLFTDALLGVDTIAYPDNPAPLLYSATENKGVYSSKFTLPFGLVIEESELNDEDVLFKHQNNLFKAFTGLDKELIAVSEADIYVVEEKRMSDEEVESLHNKLEEKSSLLPGFSIEDAYNSNSSEENSQGSEEAQDASAADEVDDVYFREYRLEIPVNEMSSIYLAATKDFVGEVAIAIDNELKPIEGYTMIGLYKYPNSVRSGILSLGSYENDTVSVSLYTYNDKLDGLEIGILDMNIIKEGFEILKSNQVLNTTYLKNGMNLTGYVSKSGTLFIPVSYSGNWRAKLNGVPVSIKPYINNAFIAIDVSEGDINLEMSYLPEGLRNGISLTVLGIVLFVILCIYGKLIRFKNKAGEILSEILVYGYSFAVFLLFVTFYVIPIYIKMAL